MNADDELRAAIGAVSAEKCAECGTELGKHWTERLNAAGDRLEKVHADCA